MEPEDGNQTYADQQQADYERMLQEGLTDGEARQAISAQALMDAAKLGNLIEQGNINTLFTGGKRN